MSGPLTRPVNERWMRDKETRVCGFSPPESQSARVTVPSSLRGGFSRCNQRVRAAIVLIFLRLNTDYDG